MKVFNITSMKRLLILSCALNIVSIIIVLFVVSASAKNMKRAEFIDITLMKSGYQLKTYRGVLECIRHNDITNALEILEFHSDIEVSGIFRMLAKTDDPEIRELELGGLRRAADYRKKYPRKMEAVFSNFGQPDDDYKDIVKEAADILSNKLTHK